LGGIVHSGMFQDDDNQSMGIGAARQYAKLLIGLWQTIIQRESGLTRYLAC
jgi:hypothetical protein